MCWIEGADGWQRISLGLDNHSRTIEIRLMNKYQRVGVFLVRVLGAMALALGLLGVILAASEHAGLLTPDPSWPSSVGVSLVWIVVGGLLVGIARPVGRLLGKGLE
jgi:hypothetical protein